MSRTTTEMSLLRYRMEVVQAWPVSPRRDAYMGGIRHRMDILKQQEQQNTIRSVQ